jgi:hypothetical protein
VLYYLNLKTRQICYGDALGGSPNPEDISSLRRFLGHITTSSFASGSDLQMSRQTDGHSCAITVCDLICELTMGTRPWIPSERNLRRVEYALFLCLGTNICSSEDLGMGSEALKNIKNGVLAADDMVCLRFNDQQNSWPTTEKESRQTIHLLHKATQGSRNISDLVKTGT